MNGTLRDEYVQWLQVAVHNTTPVHVRQRLQQLDQQSDLRFERRIAPRLQDCLRSFQQIHRVERQPLIVKAVVKHADDVGMAE